MTKKSYMKCHHLYFAFPHLIKVGVFCLPLIVVSLAMVLADFTSRYPSERNPLTWKKKPAKNQRELVCFLVQGLQPDLSCDITTDSNIKSVIKTNKSRGIYLGNIFLKWSNCSERWSVLNRGENTSCLSDRTAPQSTDPYSGLQTQRPYFCWKNQKNPLNGNNARVHKSQERIWILAS